MNFNIMEWLPFASMAIAILLVTGAALKKLSAVSFVVALFCFLLAIEQARGWPTHFAEPPDPMILYSVNGFDGIVAAPVNDMQAMRLYRFVFDPKLRLLLKGGPLILGSDSGLGSLDLKRLPGNENTLKGKYQSGGAITNLFPKDQ